MTKAELNQITVTDKEHAIIVLAIGRFGEFTKSHLLYLTMYDEMKELYEKREKITALIRHDYVTEYNRIRTMHKDTAIAIHANSCSGCFNSLTKQLVVDVRNNLNVFHYFENCGRILLPEDFSIDESDIEKL